jgi:hypothetical protein
MRWMFVAMFMAVTEYSQPWRFSISVSFPEDPSRPVIGPGARSGACRRASRRDWVGR